MTVLAKNNHFHLNWSFWKTIKIFVKLPQANPSQFDENESNVTQFSGTMSLWDPEAAGNAACFLRLTDIQMLEIRNAPFEGGKAVWVPNTETGYIKGEITGEGEKPNTTKVNID